MHSIEKLVWDGTGSAESSASFAEREPTAADVSCPVPSRAGRWRGKQTHNPLSNQKKKRWLQREDTWHLACSDESEVSGIANATLLRQFGWPEI